MSGIFTFIFYLVMYRVMLRVVLFMIPFGIIGFMFAGSRPMLMPTILWSLAIVVFGLWSFGAFWLVIGYAVAAGGYQLGGTFRTGKTQEELLNG